ncbi:tRNA pseudouridine synthase A [Polystyrenella longa]|uniref:tRNA pseudouridine synthase A n=1 Tax=Polystyrenella longa TaxID=2528007 RepID=A0A518CH67_9PLAN|nr:tRNA pseudouridine(38-40) synthase TruA [Polystyrenella longa]QDU78568.1 tRNA pseudouridine synthase A [Polystyrenella longa]
MRNLKLTIAYDGTNYVGWQVQPNGVSVQEVVEKAIGKLTREQKRVYVAGRTDSGVHAVGQTANFHTDVNIPIEKIKLGLQRYLPADVVIRNVEEVSPDFHATFSATGKHYRYLLLNSRTPNPLLRSYAYRHQTPLDIDLMQQGAEYLLGKHDFRCFESNYPNKATSVRTMYSVKVTRQSGWSMWGPAAGPGEETPLVVFDIVGGGFLYNMVRAIMGTLLKIGQGKWPPERMQEIIDAQDRSIAGETAPAQGLYLIEVMYDAGDVGLKPQMDTD